MSSVCSEASNTEQKDVDDTDPQASSLTPHCDKCEKSLQSRLAWYTESRFHDCSFSIGKEYPKIFKCHKVVLASASEAFAKMLSENFAEGCVKHKDDPIFLNDGTAPEIFDQAMRFIYGNENSFSSSIHLTCEVYKFAHKWLILLLKQAAVEILRKVEVDQVLQVFEMHRLLGDTKERQYYLKEVIAKRTSEVLSSPQWVNAASLVVLDIFNEPVLNVSSERELFDALIKWGKANTDSTANLRTVINSALREIRFIAMDAKVVAELCIAHADIFTPEEKYQLMASTAIADHRHMPPSFSISGMNRKEKFGCTLSFGPEILSDVDVNRDSPASSLTIYFEGDAPIFLHRVELDCLILKVNHGKEFDLTCAVYEHESEMPVAQVRVTGVIGAEQTDVLFARPVLIKMCTNYTISVNYLSQDHLATHKYECNDPDIHFFPETLDVILPELSSHVDMKRLKFFVE